jgi:hypothetical protein
MESDGDSSDAEASVPSVRARFGAPLPGPVDSSPAVGPVEAVEMLAVATRGLRLGAADRALLERVGHAWEWADVAVLASLLWRARRAPE